jgi:Xaa-Pro aminopeptidase
MSSQTIDIKKYKAAQDIARKTMHDLHGYIKPGVSEAAITKKATQLLSDYGSNSWWYHGIGAFVLLGKRSTLSMSGTEHTPSEDNLVGENDVVTIDLAPTLDGYWGDYARTIFIENGMVANEDQPTVPEFRQGLEAELYIHKRLFDLVTPEMTYENLFFLLNEEIKQLGFENLDFHGNLGHSIEFEQSDRIYIEKGNQTTFSECGKPFTVEPHIRVKGGAYGYKRENIYYFDSNGTLICL